jgi:DNA-directed RNA polymerase I, II, and III subunit RPABC5
MIIPIKCFTCGKVIADKYRYYLAEVRKRKKDLDIDENEVQYFTTENITKTIEGEVLDELKLTKICCRRHFLCHVDID